MITKACQSIEVKDASTGRVEAVFSTLNVVDLDGDVTLPGAFTNGAPVIISGFGHTSWSGAPPIGKGRIRTTPTEAILEGQFFLDTTHGADAFTTVRELGELQEWSYSLHDVKARFGEHDGKRVRFIESVRVHEVSPVLQGAGIGTRTLVAKAARQSHDPDIDWLLGIEYLRYSYHQMRAREIEASRG